MRYRPVFNQLQLQSQQQSTVDSRYTVSHWLDASCNSNSNNNNNSNSPSRPEVAQPLTSPSPSPSPSASPPQSQLQSPVRRRISKPLQQSHGNQLTTVQPSRKRKMADRDDKVSEPASRGGHGRELRDGNALQKPRWNKEQGLHDQQIHIQSGYTQQGPSKRRQSPVKTTASGPPSTPRGLDLVPPATPVFDADRGALPKIQSPSKRSSNPSSQSAVSQRAQMARLENPIRFVTSKQRFESNKDESPAANLWFHIRSGSHEKVVPSSLKVKPTI